MKELKLAYSKIIPFKGYYAIMLWGYLIRREKYKNIPVSETTWLHETIHLYQAYDFGIKFFGFLFFYLLYFLEWLLKLPVFIFGFSVYNSISFEQEAYNNQKNLNYLQERKRFAWAKYIFKLVKKEKYEN